MAIKEEKMHIYEATTNTDTIEGRGVEMVIGRFTNPGQAAKAAKGMGPMGTDGGVQAREVYVMFEAWLEGDGKKYADRHEALSSEDRVRNGALAKLTAEERRVLGLALPGVPPIEALSLGFGSNVERAREYITTMRFKASAEFRPSSIEARTSRSMADGARVALEILAGPEAVRGL